MELCGSRRIASQSSGTKDDCCLVAKDNRVVVRSERDYHVKAPHVKKMPPVKVPRSTQKAFPGGKIQGVAHSPSSFVLWWTCN